MYLTAIDIRNFRSFDYLKIEDFGQINIILGKNNVGKTSLMEAILLPISSTYPLALFNLNQIREFRNRDLESLQSFFYNLSFSNIPTIHAKFIDLVGNESTREVIISADSSAFAIIDSKKNLDKSSNIATILPSSFINQINVKTRLENNEEIVFALSYDIEGNISIKQPKYIDQKQAAIFYLRHRQKNHF